METDYFELYIAPLGLHKKGFKWYFWTALSEESFMKTMNISDMFGHADGAECSRPERKWISIVHSMVLWFIFKDERDAMLFKLAFGGPEMHLTITEE